MDFVGSTGDEAPRTGPRSSSILVSSPATMLLVKPGYQQTYLVRDHLSKHQDFQKDPEYPRLQSIFKTLVVPSTAPFTRHAYLQ